MKHHRCSYKQFNRKVEELNMPEYTFKFWESNMTVSVYFTEDVEGHNYGYYWNKAICYFDAYAFRKGDNEMIKKGIKFADEHLMKTLDGKYEEMCIDLEVE